MYIILDKIFFFSTKDFKGQKISHHDPKRIKCIHFTAFSVRPLKTQEHKQNDWAHLAACQAD